MRDDLIEEMSFTVEYKGTVSIDGYAIIKHNNIPYRADEPYELYDIDVYFIHPKTAQSISLSEINKILKGLEVEDKHNWEKAVEKIKEIDKDKFIQYNTITLIDKIAINLSQQKGWSEEQKFDVIIDIPIHNSQNMEKELQKIEDIILKEEFDNSCNEYYFILDLDKDNEEILNKLKELKYNYDTIYNLDFTITDPEFKKNIKVETERYTPRM